MALVATSSMHYLSIVPLILKYDTKPHTLLHRVYIGIITITTSLSILWHYYNESNLILQAVELVFVATWFALDNLWSFILLKHEIIIYNYLVLLVYIVSALFKQYRVYHSIYHIISAVKCIQVSYIIYKSYIHKSIPLQYDKKLKACMV